MKPKLQSIESRLTIYVLLFSVILGVAFSSVQIGFDYVGERQRFTEQTRALLARQQASAALALYNYDNHAMTTILDSLRLNPAIVASELQELNSDFGVISGWSAEQRDEAVKSPNIVAFRQDLMEPQTYTTGQKALGMLTVWADERLLHQGFEQRAGLTLMLDVLRNIVLAFVLIMVFRSRLTGPIKRLTARILDVDPKSPVKLPLSVESQLKNSELDDLTNKMNALLSSMDDEITQRDLAEKQVRFLNEKLEEKVRLRTEALHTSNQQLQNSLDELKQTQHLLVKAQNMAALGQLAGGMAHEINNPIAVVNSNLNMLSDYLNDLMSVVGALEGKDPQVSEQPDVLLQKLRVLKKQVDFDFIREDSADLLTACLQSTNRVQNIVDELQTFVGGESHDHQATQLSTLFRSAVQENQLHESNAIQIIEHFDCAHDDLLCNARQVTMVLGKILRNARDAMPDGGVIDATIMTSDKHMCLTIQDYGVGMSEEELMFATNPFYTRKEVGQGMGMGLTVAYNVMSNHGGSLEIDSTKGEGTCVKLTFPHALAPE